MNMSTEIGISRCTRLGEFCSCCCLPLLLNLPAAFSQPGNGLSERLCTCSYASLETFSQSTRVLEALFGSVRPSVRVSICISFRRLRSPLSLPPAVAMAAKAAETGSSSHLPKCPTERRHSPSTDYGLRGRPGSAMEGSLHQRLLQVLVTHLFGLDQGEQHTFETLHSQLLYSWSFMMYMYLVHDPV